MRHNGWTPKQTARALVLREIMGLARMIERDGQDTDEPRAFTAEIVRQLCKIHNDMLDRSGLDGLHIEPRQWSTEVQSANAMQPKTASVGVVRCTCHGLTAAECPNWNC